MTDVDDDANQPARSEFQPADPVPWVPLRDVDGDDQDRRVAGLADALKALRRENQDLRQALTSQPVIDQAKGALMVRYGIDADRAFQTLARWSQHTNTKVRTIAEVVVYAICQGEADQAPVLVREVEQLLRHPPGPEEPVRGQAALAAPVERTGTEGDGTPRG